MTYRIGLGGVIGGALLLAGAFVTPVLAAGAPGVVQMVQYRDGGDRYDRGDRGDRYDRGERNDRGNRGGGGGGGGRAPGGSYQQSCSNVRLQGSTLQAICKGDRGRRFETSIDVNRCRGDIGNQFGALSCQGTQGQSRRID